MNSNWFGKLTTSALALTVGTGMLFLSGCNNDCDNCEDKTVETSCCDEVAPIETSYEPTVSSDRSDAARRDVDSYDNNAAQAAPAPDVSAQVQAPAAPAAPAPDVNAQAQAPAAPAAPAPDVSAQAQAPAAPAAPAAPPAPAPTAQAPAPAPDVNTPAAKSEADKSFNVNVNNEINNAPPAPKADAGAPAADLRGDNDKMHADKVPLSSDLQPLSFFEGKWNLDEHFTGDDGMGLGSNAQGTMYFRSSLEGHALMGHMSLKGDKGEFHGMVIITAPMSAKGSASANDLKSEEKPIATSADNSSAPAMDVSTNKFNVFWTDSMGHTGMAKDASWDGTKFSETFQYDVNGKSVTKHATYTKESDDKVTFTVEKDSGDGFKAICNGTMTRAADSGKDHHSK